VARAPWTSISFWLLIAARPNHREGSGWPLPGRPRPLPAMSFEGLDEVRHGAGYVDRAGGTQEREDVLDDGGKDPGVDEAADLGCPLEGLQVVVSVAVRGTSFHGSRVKPIAVSFG
jgi:hypothetical protein